VISIGSMSKSVLPVNNDIDTFIGSSHSVSMLPSDNEKAVDISLQTSSISADTSLDADEEEERPYFFSPRGGASDDVSVRFDCIECKVGNRLFRMVCTSTDDAPPVFKEVFP
jgi:hypothetical protein